ncbi:hypothetical protein [Kitasatospora sp. NPDC056181]|uniref:hypothetical protein n=1 Tax=Kitasatospora sp. NPDC056181 TaxID=3345737 RepID=UPI0035E1C24C
MNPDQQSDRRLRDAMQYTSDAFGPHRPDLVRRAAARGRRLRLVRRVQIGTAAAAVAGAAALGASQLPLRAAPAPPAAVTTAPTATPTATAAPTPTRSPSAAPPVGGPRTGPVSAQLAEFLPPGSTTRVLSTGSFEDGRLATSAGGTSVADGQVLYDDGKGRASVAVKVMDTPQSTSRSCEQAVKPLFCDVLPDGTVVKAEKLSLVNGQVAWVVTATRPDLRRVEAAAFNTDQLPVTAANRPTRAEPPLTIDQLQGIALSPHWNR